MDHQPDKAVITLLNLDEMVAAAQRAELVARREELCLNNGDIRCAVETVPWLWVRVMFEAYGYFGADDGQNLLQRVGADLLQAGAHGRHTAADIHPDGIGDDHIPRGEHAANGHAVTGVGVGHHGHPAKGEGQVGQVARLLQGGRVDIRRPQFDGNALGGDYLHNYRIARDGDVCLIRIPLPPLQRG